MREKQKLTINDAKVLTNLFDKKMFRIDSVCDRIYFNAIEAENASNKFKEVSEELRENFFMKLFKDFETQEIQNRIHKIINKPEAVEELKLMFSIIDKKINSEREKEEKGIASYLLALLLNNIPNSEHLWKNIIKLIEVKDTEMLDTFLNRKSVFIAMSTVIESFLNSLCQVGDEFFVDTEGNESLDSKQMKFFNSLETSHMIIVIHHLLFHPKTSAYFNQQIFTTFNLSPHFIDFLKLSLRTLSL